jgi:hypothetical protein
LAGQFKHEKTNFLPQAQSDWIDLYVMDFPNFLAFNFEFHCIVGQLRLCGDTINDTEMIDKTQSTFYPAFAILTQQYCNMNFNTHSELMSYLLLAEKKQQLLLKNTESRPAKEIHNSEVQNPLMPTSSVLTAHPKSNNLDLRCTTPEAKGKLEAQSHVTPIFQTPKVHE